MINVTKTKLPPLEEYTKYLQRIWENNWITNDGEFSLKLKKDLEKFLQVKHLSLVGNGTWAMQLAFKALNLSGEVITTPFTFPATTHSLLWEGLKPVFADVDPDTFNIDPKEVEKKITKKTSAILAVHVFGNPCNVEALDKIAKKNNLKVIYDAAHAFGVTYKNKSILQWGDVSTLSFHAAKTFHTIEGGAVITKGTKLEKEIKLLSNHGIKTYDKVVRAGINARINEFEAVMGILLLKGYERERKKRKKIYELYGSSLVKNHKIRLQELNKNITQFNYPYFPVVFSDEKVAVKVMKALHKNDIRPRRYFYPPSHELPHINDRSSGISHASYISHSVLCLPLYAELELETAEKIVSIIRNEIS